MIKTLAIPQNNSYNLAIPNNYIGKKIEIIFYALDEIVEEKVKPTKTMADFCGILSDSDYSSLKEHTEQARTEWNRAI
ncbi:MAG: hypothetical protein QE277_00565 [Flectobacillus sp.]|nr:hypothetical protein [Flectobacillus sp.]